MLTRRQFVASAAAALAVRAPAQVAATRLNLAELERERILREAAVAVVRPIQPSGDPASQAFLDFTLDMPTLAAAHLLTRDPRYPVAAAAHLRAWLLDPHFHLPTTPAMPADVASTASMAEVSLSLPFLFPPDGQAVYRPWFEETLTNLNEQRAAGLARDLPDHVGASWLLQVAAFARLLGDERALTAARHRFKTLTLRAEINSGGAFPHELTTANPFRNSLFTLDLLAGVCALLTTPYESLWNYELQDGPGMRSAVAHHAPFLERPTSWPYPADASHFHELPCRRPALLLAARAYAVPEYARLWRNLEPAEPASPELLRSFPIRQPILWQTQPPRVPE